MSLSCGDTGASLENRKVFLGDLGIDYRRLVCAKQVHARKIACVQESDQGRGALAFGTAIADTDALITNRKNLPLAVFTADCLSIFLYSKRKPAIGLAHAGWRSTKAGIAALTIELMQQELGIKAGDLHVVLGPAIKDCCYEVGEDLKDFEYGLIQRSQRNYFDLTGVNKKQILNSGVKEGNIFDSGFCTCCRNSNFFSFRRDGKNCGRMISVIMLI